MNWLNFTIYDKEEEKINGAYWKFLEATSETLLKENIYLGDISKIINEQLKRKCFNYKYFIIKR